jgi:hypothetical protein
VINAFVGWEGSRRLDALLERLGRSGLIGKIDELQVQFRDFVSQAAARRQALVEMLAGTPACAETMSSPHLFWLSAPRITHEHPTS